MKLEAECEKCDYRWFPYGMKAYVLPHKDKLTCPKCKVKFKFIWLDEETMKLQKRKEMGLFNNGENDTKELKNQMEIMKQKYNVLESQNKVVELKCELLERSMKTFEIWANKREEIFKVLDERAREIEEENEFREKHK